MKSFNKVISGLVIGGTLLSTGAVAMAGTKTAGKNINFQGRPPIAGRMMRGGDIDRSSFGKGIMKNNIESCLNALVSAGVITQDESDRILALSKQETEARQAEMDKVRNMTDDERKAYFESIKGQIAERKGDIFELAVSNGIITQEKADAAKAKLQETYAAERNAKLAEGLSNLVSAGTITQEQADKVLAFIDTLKAGKLSSATDTAAAPKVEKINPLSQLVDEGTLTQEQLDAVKKALFIGGGRIQGGPGRFNGKRDSGGARMDRQAKADTDTNSPAATQ